MLGVVNLSRSTYYSKCRIEPKPRQTGGGRPVPGYSIDLFGESVSDDLIKERLMEIIESDGFYYGYNKLTHCLKRKHRLMVNKKKVYRLLKEMNLLRPQRKIKEKYPRRLARNRVITASNQLWEIDLKYGYIRGEDRFFYVASLLDVYDRSIVSYHIGLSCTSRDVSFALKEGYLKRGSPNVVIRTDNGPQFKGFAFEETCLKLGLEHERIPCRTPNKIAHIESFHRIFEDECLSQEFHNFAEAYSTIVAFMEFYNTSRLHSSIGYLAPIEFMKKKGGNIPIKMNEIRV